MRDALSHTATCANQLIGGLDLLRALLGALEHRVRQTIGLELIGMMAAHLPAVGLDDLLIRHAWLGHEHAVGLSQALLAGEAARRTGPIMGAACRSAARACRALAPAQYALESREFRWAQAQQHRHASQPRARQLR